MNSPVIVKVAVIAKVAVIVKVAVIANAVKQSMSLDCMDCRASLAVTKALFKIVCGISPDTGGLAMTKKLLSF
jgi:hypothetical protein